MHGLNENFRKNLYSNGIGSIQQIIDSLKVGYISFDKVRIGEIDIYTEISPEIFVDYVYGNNAVEMRKKNLEWFNYHAGAQNTF